MVSACMFTSDSIAIDLDQYAFFYPMSFFSKPYLGD